MVSQTINNHVSGYCLDTIKHKRSDAVLNLLLLAHQPILYSVLLPLGKDSYLSLSLLWVTQ